MRKGSLAGAMRLVAALAAALSTLALPAVAAADDRFAEVDGDGAEPCLQADPCSIVTAVNGAIAGDDVTLLGGVPPAAPYTLAAALTIPSGVTVHGSPGARPRLHGNFVDDFAVGVQASAVLRDASVSHSDSGNAAVFVDGGTVERVHARSAGGGCVADPDSLIRDSVCWTTGGVRGGFTAQGPNTGTVTLRNVTAIATEGTQPGLLAFAFATNATLNVNATNVIAYSAGGSDVTGAGTPAFTGEVVNINLDHSNYDSVDESNTEATVSITDPGDGTNQTAEPVLVDADNGDFRQAATSTGTIDQGVAGVVNGFALGALDVDGLARFQGPAPDIGAHEFPVAPPPQGPQPQPLLPQPTPGAGASPTGQRAAALKKCAKIKSKPKKKRCKKRARALPV